MRTARGEGKWKCVLNSILSWLASRLQEGRGLQGGGETEMREEEMSLVPQSGAEKGTCLARFLTLEERRKKS
jgi:hypothetical protein